jgi:zinc D-Ala-D-Ala dipeptidase
LNRRHFVAACFALPTVACDRGVVKQPPQPSPPKAALPLTGGLVELNRLDPTIRLDIRYATTDNFTGRRLYAQPRAFLVEPAAKALIAAHKALNADGFGLTIFDAYRPWRVTKALWDATPPGPKRNFVANPKRGSKHNRGCAVDLTLHHRDSGALVTMPSGYDEFTHRADRRFTGAPAEALHHRAVLEQAMQAQSFRGASNEWWHFDFNGWADYPLLDLPFEDLA